VHPAMQVVVASVLSCCAGWLPSLSWVAVAAVQLLSCTWAVMPCCTFFSGPCLVQVPCRAGMVHGSSCRRPGGRPRPLDASCCCPPLGSSLPFSAWESAGRPWPVSCSCCLSGACSSPCRIVGPMAVPFSHCAGAPSHAICACACSDPFVVMVG
jgi:hypothetical protein